jgi:hypothetical protein
MSCIAETSSCGTCVAVFLDMTTTIATYDLAVWRERIRAEYVEMPGLHLTRRQAQRLWGLDESTCEAVLIALEDERFLRRTQAGTYSRA